MGEGVAVGAGSDAGASVESGENAGVSVTSAAPGVNSSSAVGEKSAPAASVSVTAKTGVASGSVPPLKPFLITGHSLIAPNTAAATRIIPITRGKTTRLALFSFLFSFLFNLLPSIVKKCRATSALNYFTYVNICMSDGPLFANA